MNNMNCCKCKCSFKNCIEEYKEGLNKEFEQMITNWIKEHPEVTSVYISQGTWSLSRMFLYPNEEIRVKLRFD